MRKFNIDPKVYGATLAESIAQSLQAERQPNAGYILAVSPIDFSKDKLWQKHQEEWELLRAREREIAKAKGWTERDARDQHARNDRRDS